MADPTRRFSGRVQDYVRYRPGYPAALLDLMVARLGLGHDTVVADIGAGTGLFSTALLERGARVIGVEPNEAMASAAEAALAAESRFRSVRGSAEATGLAAGSTDLVTAAQAFHWFDPAATRTEWNRILRPGGSALMVWNLRRLDSTPFLRDYETLLRRYGTDYGSVAERYADEAVLSAFFAPHVMQRARFDNIQVFDREGLAGRVASSSYVPAPGEVAHEPMMAALGELFSRHAIEGTVTFEYDTVAYWGRLDPA